VSRALHDEHPGVRAAGVRLAEGRSRLTRNVIDLADDPNLRVRFQVAIALGTIEDGHVPEALARIAARDVDDAWVRLAVLSGLRDAAWPFLRALLDAHPDWLAQPTPSQDRLLIQVAAILGARNRAAELSGLTARIAPGSAESADGGRVALLAGLATGLMRVGRSPRDLLVNPSPELGESSRGIGVLLDRAQRVAETASGSAESRAQALEVLARYRPEVVAALITRWLHPDQPAPVQAVAARAVAAVGTPPLVSEILGRWGELPTVTRRAVLAALLESTRLTPALLKALEAGTVGFSELEATHRDALRRLPNAELRHRAESLFTKHAPPDRGAVLCTYQAALAMPGDARRGAALFARNCATCHQHRGKGQRVGPDLSGIGGRPAAVLLDDILDPNRDVVPDYLSFVVVTKAGQVLSGLLVEETATSLKIRRAEGIEDTLLRSEVEDFRPSGRSLMPEGLEQSLGMQGLADLLAYLRQL
jgi:putative heme-binding domain-containing protein